MKRLTLALLLMAMLVPATAEAYPCRQNGKEMPAQACAFANMNEYMGRAYFRPAFKAFWVKPTAVGRFHSRWVAYVPTAGGLLVVRQVGLSAKRCGGRFCVFDHRKGIWW